MAQLELRRAIIAERDDVLATSRRVEQRQAHELHHRQIAGAFAQLEKARLVAKLRGARERKGATA